MAYDVVQLRPTPWRGLRNSQHIRPRANPACWRWFVLRHRPADRHAGLSWTRDLQFSESRIYEWRTCELPPRNRPTSHGHLTDGALSHGPRVPLASAITVQLAVECRSRAITRKIAGHLCLVCGLSWSETAGVERGPRWALQSELHLPHPFAECPYFRLQLLTASIPPAVDEWFDGACSLYVRSFH